MLVPNPLLQLVLDLAGIFVFALSGGLVAVRRRLDLFGALVLAVVTGLGGGLLRDVLIGDLPPAALADWRYLVTPVVAGLVTFWLHPGLARIERAIRIFDAAGLGLFTVTGTVKALSFGLGPPAAVLLGALSAIGGGMIRDILAGQVPVVLRRELYAVPALAGAALVVAADAAGIYGPPVALAAAVFVVAFRLLAVVRGWNAPTPAGESG